MEHRFVDSQSLCTSDDDVAYSAAELVLDILVETTDMLLYFQPAVGLVGVYVFIRIYEYSSD